MMLECKDHSELTCSLYDLMSQLRMGIGRRRRNYVGRENEGEWRFTPDSQPVRRKAPIVCVKVPKLGGSCPLHGD